jgi:hypothetical protein
VNDQTTAPHGQQAAKQMAEQDGETRLGIRLTGQEQALLAAIVAARHPGRERMHSATIGELIREEYARMRRAQQKREKRAEQREAARDE